MNKANNFLLQFQKNGEFDFDSGLAVFSKYCKNRTLLAFFQNKRNQYTVDKLKYELGKIAHLVKTPISVVKVETIVEPPSDNPIQAPTRIIDPIVYETVSIQRNAPVTISSGLTEQIKEQQRLLYRKRGHIHGQLHNAKSDSERFKLAKELLDIRKQIDELYKEKIDIEAVMPNALKKELTASEFTRIRNLKMYISRDQKKLNSATTPEAKEKYAGLLEKHQTELNKLL